MIVDVLLKITRKYSGVDVIELVQHIRPQLYQYPGYPEYRLGYE